MSDIIETIDAKHDENEPTDGFCVAVWSAWPALRDRLVAAERKARAFDAVASGDVELYEIHRPAYWTVETTSDPLRAVSDPDLLTAIEAALDKETT